MTMIGTSVDSANAIALQADGKIVAVGRTVIGATADFGVARYGYGTNAQGNDGFIGLDPTTANKALLHDSRAHFRLRKPISSIRSPAKVGSFQAR